MHEIDPYACSCATHRDAMHLLLQHQQHTRMIMPLYRSGQRAKIAGLHQLTDSLQSYLAGAKESQQECNRICFDMGTPSCVFMLHNGWKQSCCTQQCTARHDVLKKLPAQARQVVKTQQLYKLRSASSGHHASQACSIGSSHGHAANWHDRCALTLCQ